ncbi:hypothetical protein Tco_0600647 [Tanacetum coccineum]
MKGRSSSKQGRSSKVVGVSMEKDKVDKVKEEPHLSGAYIRSLVKHLSSTRTKDSVNGDADMIPKPDGECFSDHNNMQPETPSPPPPLQQPPHKKQVRRRQHTTKPYQERLLNMAEARKEIVTALKYHRASKQESSNTLDLKSSSQTHPQSEQPPCTTTNFSNHYPSLSCPPSIPYYWTIPTIIPPPLPPPYHENVNFALPSQTLGLNLNFHDFKNLDANLYHNPLSNSSASSSASASSCSSTSTSSSAAISEAVVPMPEEVMTNSSSGSDLHHAMDEYEMEEIRSLGEQHQIEWNDRVNLVKSARWFKFLKTIEIGPEDAKVDDGLDFFDQVMEVPSWLINANEHVDDHFSDDYLQDPSLNW